MSFLASSMGLSCCWRPLAASIRQTCWIARRCCPELHKVFEVPRCLLIFLHETQNTPIIHGDCAIYLPWCRSVIGILVEGRVSLQNAASQEGMEWWLVWMFVRRLDIFKELNDERRIIVRSNPYVRFFQPRGVILLDKLVAILICSWDYHP